MNGCDCLEPAHGVFVRAPSGAGTAAWVLKFLPCGCIIDDTHARKKLGEQHGGPVAARIRRNDGSPAGPAVQRFPQPACVYPKRPGTSRTIELHRRLLQHSA